MKMHGRSCGQRNGARLGCIGLIFLLALTGPAVVEVDGQAIVPTNVPQQIQELNDAIARTQSQLDESQKELKELRTQLAALRAQLAGGQNISPAPVAEVKADSSSTDDADAELQGLRERQTMQEAQIATHEQSKVESVSKYPVKLTGLLLLSGFANTGAVDLPSTPTLAIPGDGSTGISLRQSVLGFDARGPHLLGASSYADLRVDFAGSVQSEVSITTYTGYYGSNARLLRLRTAHAGLSWKHTDASFSLDRPIFNPDSPTSLTAVAEPPLAWSGSLWTWNPQVSVSHDLVFKDAYSLRLQAGMIDAGDAPYSPTTLTDPTITPPGAAEQSRWPGAEARVALIGKAAQQESSHIGIGGYFSAHDTSLGSNFNSWAATADARFALPGQLQLTGFFYRGLGLGGLGGGGYKDFGYKVNTVTGGYRVRGLSDVGGWAELKEKPSQRIEFNAAFGLDNVFGKELQRYVTVGGPAYLNLARNRTYTGNIIYSPSAYLLFSFEYRHLTSAFEQSPTTSSNIYGLAAGYKF